MGGSWPGGRRRKKGGTTERVIPVAAEDMSLFGAHFATDLRGIAEKAAATCGNAS